MATNEWLLFIWDAIRQLLMTAALHILVGSCNVLRLKLFADPNKPPVVLHWYPFVGSTTAYGKDPYNFFLYCQAKVSCVVSARPREDKVDRYYSMETSSPSSFSAGKLPSTWAKKGISSY